MNDWTLTENDLVERIKKDGWTVDFNQLSAADLATAEGLKLKKWLLPMLSKQAPRSFVVHLIPATRHFLLNDEEHAALRT